MGSDSLELRFVFSGFHQRLMLNGQLFRARIYSGVSFPPKGFNTVLLSLDGSTHSHLNWDRILEQAKKLVEKGYYILWEIRFDLYADSLTDEGRFAVLKFSVEHFSKTVWPLFQSSTIGVILHRGSLDFSDGFPWTAEEKEFYHEPCGHQALFCRDNVIDYFKRLAVFLPEGLCCFFLLDTDSIADPLLFFQLTNRASIGPFQLILKGRLAQEFPFAFPALGWNHGSSALGFLSETTHDLLSEQEVKQALLLPSKCKDEIRATLLQLCKPFQVLSESLLTHQWEGVEELIVFSDYVGIRERRKLLGFCAAEGKVLSVGPPLGLANEKSIKAHLNGES